MLYEIKQITSTYNTTAGNDGGRARWREDHRLKKMKMKESGTIQGQRGNKVCSERLMIHCMQVDPRHRKVFAVFSRQRGIKDEPERFKIIDNKVS